MADERLVSFKSEYAAMLVPFISEDETRRYLHGIGVFPHHEKGVLLVGTNGHVAGIIHDEDGETNGDWICPLTDALKTAITPQMRTIHDEDIGEYRYDARDRKPDWLSFIGDVGYLTVGAKPSLKDVPVISSDHAAVDYAPAIDAKFPDWRRIVPAELPPPQPIPFCAVYLSDFYAVAQVRNLSCITLFSGEKTGPAVVRVNDIPEFLGIIMPIKLDVPEALPDWLPSAGKPSKVA